MNNDAHFRLGELADAGAARYRRPCEILGLQSDVLRSQLRMMRLVRSAEEQIGQWAENGTVRCPCHLSIGQEAIAVGVAQALRPTDRLFGNHRSHAHYLAVGGDLYGLFAEVLGRYTGCSRGMGGSMHLVARERGLLGSVPIVAGTVPIAVGAALAAKMDGGDAIAVAYFGDGASEEGVVHESLNLAAIYRLPVLFVCENNQYSSHLDISLRQPADRIARFAEAHRIQAALVDGNDATAVAKVATALVDEMRRERTPVFVEAVTYRWRGHVGPKEDIDVGVRRSLRDLQAWKERDPIARLEAALLAADLLSAAELAELQASVAEEVAVAAQRALEAPWPPLSALTDCVYAEGA